MIVQILFLFWTLLVTTIIIFLVLENHSNMKLINELYKIVGRNLEFTGENFDSIQKITKILLKQQSFKKEPEDD